MTMLGAVLTYGRDNIIILFYFYDVRKIEHNNAHMTNGVRWGTDEDVIRL